MGAIKCTPDGADSVIRGELVNGELTCSALRINTSGLTEFGKINELGEFIALAFIRHPSMQAGDTLHLNGEFTIHIPLTLR